MTYVICVVYSAPRMRANPGGLISPEETVGRDQLIKVIWGRLEGQSVLLTSERRIGKTCVIRKMEKEGAATLLCWMRDIEGLHSPGELIEAIYKDLEPILSKGERAKQKFFGALKALGDLQIKDIKLPKFQPHWKSLLIDIIGDACEAHKGRLVFFWDEMPLFIYNVAKTCGAEEAMILLDTLRSVRQNFTNVRMVFTGSVGMHQVVQMLRQKGYANAPTNDMAIIEVPALSPIDGTALARALLLGEEIKTLDNLESVAAAISSAASHIPFYIHTLVARIRDEANSVDTAGAEKHADALVKDCNDPADFGYYAKRITTYYEGNKANLALRVLDVLASAKEPLDFHELKNLGGHSIETDEEEVRSLLEILMKDHYISRNDMGKFSFRYPIVQKWWKFARG